jgi:hypothetical protein
LRGWIRVNDTAVDDLSQADFEKEAFGGDPDRPCAYLLFYATESALAPVSLTFSEEIRSPQLNMKNRGGSTI